MPGPGVRDLRVPSPFRLLNERPSTSPHPSGQPCQRQTPLPLPLDTRGRFTSWPPSNDGTGAKDGYMPLTTRAITSRPPPIPRSTAVSTIAIARRSVLRALSDIGGASYPATRRRALLVTDAKSRPTIGSTRRFPTCANPRTVRKRATCSTPTLRLSPAGTRDPASVRPRLERIPP